MAIICNHEKYVVAIKMFVCKDSPAEEIVTQITLLIGILVLPLGLRVL